MDAVAWGDKPPRTFREVMKRFAEVHFPTLKPSSAKRYAVSMKALSRTFGEMNIQQVSTATLSDFEVARRTEGATAPSIRRDLACLSAMLSYCEEWEWIDVGGNIVSGFMKSRAKRGLKEAQGRRRYFSEGEEAKLLAEASDMVRAAIILSIDTGLRDQELMTLTWPQVEFDKRLIRTTTDTKSRRARTVPLTQRSAQLLKSLPRHISKPFVFFGEDGEKIGRMVKGFKGAASRAKLKDVRWHDLRRTAGCRWLQRDGMTMAEVSLLLGHSSVAVTEKSYAFLNEEATAQKAAQGKRTTKKRAS